jgi:hypothetical protein
VERVTPYAPVLKSETRGLAIAAGSGLPPCQCHPFCLGIGISGDRLRANSSPASGLTRSEESDRVRSHARRKPACELTGTKCVREKLKAEIRKVGIAKQIMISTFRFPHFCFDFALSQFLLLIWAFDFSFQAKEKFFSGLLE